MELSHSWSVVGSGQNNFIIGARTSMPKWQGDVVFDDDDDFYDDELDQYEDEFGLEDDYEGFEKIRHPHKSEEEFKGGKKKSNIKHQKRPDKE